MGVKESWELVSVKHLTFRLWMSIIFLLKTKKRDLKSRRHPGGILKPKDASYKQKRPPSGMGCSSLS